MTIPDALRHPYFANRGYDPQPFEAMPKAPLRLPLEDEREVLEYSTEVVLVHASSPVRCALTSILIN